VAAVFLYLLATLPPRPQSISLEAVDRGLRERSVKAVYHIHTTRSDGGGPNEDVAAAAARAGARVAIFTDHGDGTRPPDPPVYIGGVLCLDGVEISSNGGHYVALDMPQAPYPLGGESAAVVEDVRRLGGFGLAAHPDHPVRELAWTDWNLPIDGVEWLNGDAEWRDEGRMALARVLFDYLVRPGPAVASVFDRPVATLERWDTLSRRRRVVALAAVDAHGGARTRSGAERRAAIGIGPSYEASFRSATNRLILEKPLITDAIVDARMVMDALRAGRVYSVIDAISADMVLSLSDTEGFAAASPLLSGAQVFKLSDDRVRRIEIHAARAPGTPPIPWVVSNWAGTWPRPAGEARPLPSEDLRFDLASEWRVEKDPQSSARISGNSQVITLDYRLAAGERTSQFTAAAADVRGLPESSHLVFRGRATRPMRVAVQLRFAPDDARWIRSEYLDTEEREVRVALRDLVSADRSGGQMPSLSTVRSILFVVDLVNARPGDSASFTVSDLRAAR
jgi:hypothetical protein